MDNKLFLIDGGNETKNVLPFYFMRISLFDFLVVSSVLAKNMKQVKTLFHHNKNEISFIFFCFVFLVQIKLLL